MACMTPAYKGRAEVPAQAYFPGSGTSVTVV